MRLYKYPSRKIQYRLTCTSQKKVFAEPKRGITFAALK